METVPVYCDACGRSMTFEGVSMIGVSIQFSDGNKPGMMAAIYPEIEPGCQFNICLVCWLCSLNVEGIEPLRRPKRKVI